MTSLKSEQGGYLIPGEVRVLIRGFKGWFYRLLGNKRGWETRNMHADIMAAVAKKRTERAKK